MKLHLLPRMLIGWRDSIAFGHGSLLAVMTRGQRHYDVPVADKLGSTTEQARGWMDWVAWVVPDPFF